MPEFEFDLEKSRTNLEKHGIDFTNAVRLWDDERRIIFPARTINEVRFVMIAALDGKLWSVIYTLRGDRIRLISVRRSRREEASLYHGS